MKLFGTKLLHFWHLPVLPVPGLPAMMMTITEKMRLFGEKIGIAFQIKDDLFDYASDNVGKPTGNDIKEKKLTLPLIYTLNNTDKKTRREIIYIVKNKNQDKEKVNWVIRKVKEAGGIVMLLKK